VTERYDPAPAALALAAAWREGRQLTELPADIRPATLSQGYALQEAFADALQDRVSGWKLGVGSVAAMQAAKLERPLVGRLFASRCHRGGADIRLACAAPITVEFEIAFVLSRDVAPGAAPADPIRAVASTHAAFELVQSRFVDRRAVGWPSFAGDSVGFAASILGDEIDCAAIDRIIKGATVQANGKTMAGPLAGDDLIDPVQALRYLFEHASNYGITLHKGDVVTAGAVAKPFDIAPGQTEIAAQYPGSTLRLRVATA
jgi:2-keto-4-pentenoate hydratase